MMPAQRKRANALIRKACCNYDNGNCLLLDDGEPCLCPHSISYSVCCKRKYIPAWLFKQSVSLIKQQKAIEQSISEITMMNAGKKKEEALTLLNKFFPRLEAHLGQVKKYQATIDYLTQENTGLKEKVADQTSIRKKLEAARLKQENEQLRALVAKIPPEVRREIQQRHAPQKGREERD